MRLRPAHWFAATSLLLGLVASGAATGCAAESPADDDGAVAAGEAALTVENGDQYIVEIKADTVTLRKMVEGVALKFAAKDFANKSILIHPIEKKTETGVYAHVDSVEDSYNKLVLHTRPMQLDEMENTQGSDVIRLYRNSHLPIAPSTPQPSFENLGNLLGPSGFAPAPASAGIHPLTLSGPLDGDFSPEVWVGTSRVYASGQITTSVQQAKLGFKPSAILDYTRGKGLTVGIKGEFNADLAVKAAGWAEGHVVFFESPTLKSPRITFTVPIGIPPFVVPVPIVIGVDTYVECSTLGAVEFDGVFKAHLGVTASASALIAPSIFKPLNTWVQKGPWPNTVKPEMSFTKTPGSTITGKAGIGCALPRIEFPVTIAGLIGPYVAIHPEFAVTTSGFETAIDLYAGAASEIDSERFFEVLLLRWEPGSEEK